MKTAERTSMTCVGKRTAWILFLLLLAGRSGAQTFNFPVYPYVDSMDLRSIVATTGPDTLTVAQSEFGSMYNMANGPGFTIKSLISLAKLKVNTQSLNIGLNPSFTYLITYKTLGTNPGGATTPSQVDTLSVSYNRDSLALFNDNTFKVAGSFHQLKIIIYDVFEASNPLNGATYAPLQPSQANSVSNFVYVYGEIHMQKFMTLNLNLNANNVTVTDNINNTGTVDLNWTNTFVAQNTPAGYEIEWTYVESGNQYNFRNNATRVFTNNTKFNIPVAYKEGKLVWRVRQVRPSLTDLLSRNYGNWTHADAGSIPGDAVNINRSANDSLNWDLKMSFVEDGKYKQVMTYYDGLLKQKQVQTRFNSLLGQRIIAQNLYDFEGRPVISSLPIPVKGTEKLSYEANFLHPANSNHYNKLAYDGFPDTTACPVKENPIPALDLNAKSNSYYSQYNTDKTGQNAFIPNAEGYPFTRKIFAAENPQKVLYEGQAGAPLQLGNDHQTAYLYGSPLQAELNRYFGQDVGISNHYRKMITTDNHQQDMFSITDETGKPVATGLINTPDTNSLALSIRNAPLNDTFKSNLLPFPDPKIGTDWLNNGGYFVERTTNYSLEYRIDYQAFKPCSAISKWLMPKIYYDYDLVDNCGNIKIQDNGSLGGIGVSSSPSLSYSAYKSNLLEKGNQVWRKHSYFKMDDVRTTVNAYLDSNFNDGGLCFHTFDYFLKQEFTKAKFPCPSAPTPCENLRFAMMKELYPDAKYGKYQYGDPVSKTFGMGAENSIFTGSRPIENVIKYRYQADCIVFPSSVTISGITYTNIKQMSPQQLINIFCDSIAEALLPLHPDYCKLLECPILSIPYVETLANIKRASDAQTNQHFTLSEIVADDPLLTNNILDVNQLSTGLIDGVGIDISAFKKTICATELATVESACKNIHLSKSPADILNYPSRVQDEYYYNLISLYAANRKDRLGKRAHDSAGTHCGPCKDSQIEKPVPANPKANLSTTDLFIGDLNDIRAQSGITRTPFNANTTFTLADLGSLADDNVSKECKDKVEAIMASLANCNAIAWRLDALRDTLVNRFCTSNQSIRQLTPDSLTAIMSLLGINTSDLCNPSLVGFDKLSQQAGDRVKLDILPYAPAYYENMTAFLQSKAVLEFIASEETEQTISIRLCDSTPFEQRLAVQIGVNMPTQGAAPYSCNTTLDIQMTKDVVSLPGVVKLDFYFDTTVARASYYLYPMLVQDSNIFTNSAVSATLDSFQNYRFQSLFNSYGFNQITHSYANRNTAILAFDVLKNDTPKHFQYYMSAFREQIDYTQMEQDQKEYLNGVGCSEFWAMAKPVLAQADSLGIKAGHPFYEKFLENTLNYNNKINFSAKNYKEAIQSCGMTDSVRIPKVMAHYLLKADNAYSLQQYIDIIQRTEGITLANYPCYAIGGYKYMYVDVASTNSKTYLQVLQTIIRRFGYGATYMPTLTGDTVAQLLSSSFNPVNIASLQAAFPHAFIDTTPVTTHFYIPGYNSFSFPNSTFPRSSNLITIRDTNALNNYAYNHLTDSIARYVDANAPMTPLFTQVESAVSAQYNDWEMEAWRAYVQAISPDNHNALVKASKANQFSNVNAINGYQGFSLAEFSYRNKKIPGYLNDLYINHRYAINGGAPNDNYTFISQTLSDWQDLNQGKLFQPTAPGSYIPTFSSRPGEYRALVCGDPTQFWINYFSPQQKMYNIFIRMPAFLPLPRTAYSLVQPLSQGIRRGFERDSITYLTLTLVAQFPNGLKDTIECTAHCDMSFGKSYVIPSAFLSSHSDDANAVEMPYNCEKVKLLQLYPAAHINYNLYRDSMRNVLVGQFRQHIIDNLKESLNIFGGDIKHGVTLYYYDVAGNLIKTVSPAGVKQLSVMGADNDTINAHRLRNQVTGALVPQHTKVTEYHYNAQNKVVSTTSPDAGTATTQYDLVGRVTFSQEARQRALHEYTYFLYDNLSRVIETGVVTYTGVPWPQNEYTTLGSPLANQIKGMYRREVVATLYDGPSYTTGAGPFASLPQQDNLKNRIAGVRYFEALRGGRDALQDTGYNSALHYSYDLSGNVKTLIHDLRTVMRPELRMKRVDYEYDLYSGKVLLAAYNRGMADQFFQAYKYDEDNRITDAQSSANGIIWDRDAHYTYYAHGPLARTDLGEQRVQGVDYAYTINGWLKAINGVQNHPKDDMGEDGIDPANPQASNSVVPADVFSQRIDYFSGDYKAIGDSTFFYKLPPVQKNLYNGNIAGIATALTPFPNLQSAYHYDPLQRIDRARYTEYSYDHPSSLLATNPLPDWASDYRYDKDGNLLSLHREGGTVPAALNNNTAIAQQKMDDLTYRYAAGTNKLQNLQDSAQTTDYKIDIPPTQGDTALAHYSYDESGNMTKDLVSGINDILWNRFGKVKSIGKLDGTRLNFTYDALGNRLTKQVSLYPTRDSLALLQTVYVRDASGNSLAVYEDKKEYDFVPLNIGPFIPGHTPTPSPNPTPTPTPAPGPGGVVIGVSDDFAREMSRSLLRMRAEDPTQDLADRALLLPQMADYARNPDMLRSLVASLNTEELLSLAKTLPSSIRYAVLGSEEEGVEVPEGSTLAKILMCYLEPVLLGKEQLDNEQTTLFAALKGADTNLYRHVVRNIAVDDLAKEAFPGDSALLKAYQEWVMEKKYTVLEDLSWVLTKPEYRRVLDTAFLPALCGAYSPANSYPAFVRDVPRADYIVEAIREDVSAFITYRFGQVENGTLALDSAAADFETNGPLLAAFAARSGGGTNGGAIDPDLLSTIVAERFGAVAGLAQSSGHGALLRRSLSDALAGGAALSPQMHQAFLGQQVMRLDRTYLSEHHLYGSSRLGLQKYLPSALSFEGLTLTPGVPVFQSLLQARPWYSRYGEDLFSPATVSTTLKKATISSDGLGVQSHLLGLRHYELANHLGNVQATVLDRVTPVSVDANGRPTREENSLVGYRADISSAQDYYPFGMLMPGRYTSDTSRKCVQVSQVVMVQKPWDIVIKPSKIPAPGNGGSGGSGGGKKKVVAHRYGADTTVPGVGSLPVADSFSDASLYVYHYVPAEAKTSGWVVAEKAQALGGLDYQLDLGEEPEVSVFLPLRLDTSVEVQNVRFELAGLRSNEIVAEVRARQYGVGSDSEEYQSLTDWRRLDNGEMSLGVPVNKTAVAGGGRTVVEWRFRAVSGAIVGGNIINMKAIITKAVVWVAENRVVWTCEEKDNYRFGFNGQEKDNEVRGLGSSLDFRFRMYNPLTGRFGAVDPLAREYPWNSTYAFAENDVIRCMDLEGRERSVVIYDFSGEKITRTKIELPKNGPMGNGVLISSNHGGKNAYYYGRDIANPNITSFKKAYEGVVMDKKGNHLGYPDSKGFPTIGYGHLIVKGDPYKVGGAITEGDAQSLFMSDSKSIFKQADKYLDKFNLTENQKNALYDASFNMGPGKMSQYDEGEERYSKGDFFLQFMGGGEGLKKRRFAENTLYNDNMYMHFDVVKGKQEKIAEKVATNVITPQEPKSITNANEKE